MKCTQTFLTALQIFLATLSATGTVSADDRPKFEQGECGGAGVEYSIGTVGVCADHLGFENSSTYLRDDRPKIAIYSLFTLNLTGNSPSPEQKTAEFFEDHRGDIAPVLTIMDGKWVMIGTAFRFENFYATPLHVTWTKFMCCHQNPMAN